MTANILPAEYLKLFDPDHVTGIVSYLAHESSSNVTGSAFEVGGGWYSKIRLERSEGLRYSFCPILLYYRICYHVYSIKYSLSNNIIKYT